MPSWQNVSCINTFLGQTYETSILTLVTIQMNFLTYIDERWSTSALCAVDNKIGILLYIPLSRKFLDWIWNTACWKISKPICYYIRGLLVSFGYGYSIMYKLGCMVRLRFIRSFTEDCFGQVWATTCRAVGRSENHGVPILFGGHNRPCPHDAGPWLR